MSSYNPWWETDDGNGEGIPPKPQHKPKVNIPGIANWSARASATLIEVSVAAGLETAYQIALVIFSPVFALIQVIALLFGTDIKGLFFFLDWALGASFFVWQWAVRGQTGQSLGQRLMGIRTLDEDTGYPLGSGRSILRSLLHVVDTAPVFYGYVRPIFHHRGQTLSDKISRSVVVYERRPKERPR